MIGLLWARIANPRYRCEDISARYGEITIVDKSANERLKLIAQLEEEDKNAIFRIIDGMLTKSKFKDFFNKNVAML